MLRGYRLAIIALGLTLALGGQAQPNPDQPEAETSEAATQEQWPPLPLPVQIVEEQAEKDARERIEEETRQREIDDLAAQRGMDEAAQRMANAAEVQTWIIAVGTVLVLATFIVTIAANRAAFAMVKTAEKTAERQLRAYVSVEKAEMLFVEIGKPLQVKITFRNTGQTPARKFCLVTSVGYDKPGLGPNNFSFEMPDGSPTITLGANSPLEKYIDGPKSLDKTEIHSVLKEEMSIYVFGTAQYVDVFDKRRQTDFFFFITGEKGTHFRIRTHPEGNGAT